MIHLLLADLATSRKTLTEALVTWANEKDHQFFGVKALADRPNPLG